MADDGVRLQPQGEAPEEIMAKFPDEVWTMIFAGLEDSSKDLFSCLQVCVKWRRILEERQFTWLFEEIFPFLFPYLEKNDILRSRAVCKRWRDAVDKFIENHESRLSFDESRNDLGRRTRNSVLNEKGLEWNKFLNREQMTRFMEEIGCPKSNPIWGRAVWFEFRENDANDCATAFRFLDKYGSHIWYCVIGTTGGDDTIWEFLDVLRYAMTAMPNLKALEVRRVTNLEEDDELHEEISQYLEEHPLPILNHLESLLGEFLIGLPAPIQNHLIHRHSHQLKKLEISPWEDDYFLRNLQVPHLTDLTVEVAEDGPLERVGILLNRLVDSPLGRIVIIFEDIAEEDVNMAELFGLISQFGDSLRSLRITVTPDLPGSSLHLPDTAPDEIHFRAPGLRALTLDGFNRLPMSFLKELPALEYLDINPISSTIRSVCYTNERVDLYNYLHSQDVYNSQVWKDLPKLKKIFFFKERSFVFSRETYEYLGNVKEKPIC